MPKPRITTSLFLLVSIAVAALAQEATTKKFDQEPYVVERLASKASYHADGTGTMDLDVRVRVQSQAGVQAWGIIPVAYDKASEQVNVEYVRVIKSDGSTLVTPPSDVQDVDSDVSRVAPMYSDQRQKHVAVKGLTPGDTLEYRVVSHIIKPIIENQFWLNYNFDRAGIVLNETLEIDVPATTYVNVKSADIQPTTTTENGVKIYRWKTSNLRHKTEEEKAKESKKEVPQPAIQITTFKTWEEIAKWYGGLQAERVKPSPAIQAKAAQLTKDAKTDTDKLRAIYKYVAQDFRYVGLEFGVGRYQPHAAEDVMKNGYGDCKDKHTLLASLAQAAGLKVWPVLINSSRTVDEDVPSLGQFDHVISVAEVDGKTVWLDTTPQMAPFGMLLYSLRDKKALIASDKPEWKKTPLTAGVDSYFVFNADGTISPDGVITAKVTREMRGDTEILLRLAFASVGKPDWQEVVQRVSYGTGFSGTVSNVDVSSPSNTDEPLKLSYDYERKDLPDWVEHRRMTAFLPVVPVPGVDDNDKSSDPISFEGPLRLTYHSKLQLPSGYTPELLRDVEVHNDYADYRAHYEFKDGYVIADREINYKVREIPASRRAEYKKFENAVSDDQNSYIVMKNGSSAAVANALAQTMGIPSGDNARELFEQGRSKMMMRDTRGALDLFEKASAVDPKYPGVWTAIGMCRFMQNQPEDGLKALRTEVTNYPKDEKANTALAGALAAMKRTDESLEVLRAFVKLVPENAAASGNLARGLVQQAKYDEAASVLEAAVKANPKNGALYRDLGTAYARSGHADQAVTSMEKAVELDPDDPLTLNDSAYYLADANLNLDEAEKWAEEAVQRQGDATNHIRLETLRVEDLRLMNSLASYWDTLGWVAFRKGKLPKAEKFLAAAWDLSQAPTIGDHLAQVLDKENKREQAAKLYALSYRSVVPVGFGEQPKDPSTKRLVALVGEAKAGQMLRSAGEDLSRARSTRTSKIVKVTASGEFFLLFSQGILEDVKFISGDTPMKTAAPALKSAIETKMMHPTMPDDAPVNIVRRAIVMCSTTTTTCEMVVMTPDSVTSVN